MLPPAQPDAPKKRPVEEKEVTNKVPHKRPRLEATTPVPTMTFPSRKVTASSAPLPSASLVVLPRIRNVAQSTGGKPFKPTAFKGTAISFYLYYYNL
jgi:hypothetical protein